MSTNRIAQLAVGLASTTRRYEQGFMKKATWKTHMRCLWALVAIEINKVQPCDCMDCAVSGTATH